jgi:hypothetical protein
MFTPPRGHFSVPYRPAILLGGGPIQVCQTYGQRQATGVASPMSAAAVVVGVSLVIILAITAVFALVWRGP